MKRKELIRTFNWKISCELRLYKAAVLQMEKEEIYAASYETDYMMRIYEALREKSQHMTTEALQQSIQKRNLLSFLYASWLDAPGTDDAALEQLIDKKISHIVTLAA